MILPLNRLFTNGTILSLKSVLFSAQFSSKSFFFQRDFLENRFLALLFLRIIVFIWDKIDSSDLIDFWGKKNTTVIPKYFYCVFRKLGKKRRKKFDPFESESFRTRELEIKFSSDNLKGPRSYMHHSAGNR